jgi:hypothetical protein
MAELEPISVDHLDRCCGGVFTPQGMLKAFANANQRYGERLAQFYYQGGGNAWYRESLQSNLTQAEREVKRIGTWLRNRL